MPALPDRVWRRLPMAGDGLEEAAAACYGCTADEILPVPGSQYAIQALPALREPGPVALPHWGYEEHRSAWLDAGHQPRWYRHGEELKQLLADPAVRHAVVINPNNPTGAVTPPETLRPMAGTLADRGGLLVVDEAFADPTPDISLVGHRPRGAVVLRSVGKFFGLAGLRLGFAIAGPEVLAAMARDIPPWSVSHPARWVGRRALADRAWQTTQRRRLDAASTPWLAFLAGIFPELRFSGCALFASGRGDWQRCLAIYRAAGTRGLLLRLIGPRDGEGIVRLGLPAEGERDRIDSILREVARRSA